MTKWSDAAGGGAIKADDGSVVFVHLKEKLRDDGDIGLDPDVPQPATRTERARTKAVGAALSFASAAIALAATPWHEPREPREPIPKPGPSKAKREARKRVKAARKASRR